MPKPELTKKLIAETLKGLAVHKPLDKISVGEIAEKAGLNRQTFYYHFQDKQELVCWIFDSEVAGVTDKNHNNTIIDDIVEYIYAEKAFYIAALTSEVQNNLRDHIYDVCCAHLVEKLLAILGDRQIEETAVLFLARFFTNGLVGSLVDWAQEGMKIDDIQFLEEYTPMLEELLVFIVDRYTQEQC